MRETRGTTATLLWVTIIQTFLRMLPFPCRTGLVRIGQPGPDSPVLLTGNFRLTVERVKRALRGVDAYLLVANSRARPAELAATGIEGRGVHRKTGWRVVWGPVRADDLPAFLDAGLTASPAMRSVEFPRARAVVIDPVDWLMLLGSLCSGSGGSARAPPPPRGP